MNEILQQLSLCIEKGRVNKDSNYPADMKGMPGAVELTQQALSEGTHAQDILNIGFLPGMKIVANNFLKHRVFFKFIKSSWHSFALIIITFLCQQLRLFTSWLP